MLDKEDFYDLGLDDEFDEDELDGVFDMKDTAKKQHKKDNDTKSSLLADLISGVVTEALNTYSDRKKSNWKNELRDNIKYGIDPIDYDTKAEYTEALQEAEEEYETALDDAEFALDDASSYVYDAISAIDDVVDALGQSNAVLDKTLSSLNDALSSVKAAQNAFNEIKK